MIDVGANLTNAAFDADRDAVVARARAAGVDDIVVTGTSVADSRAAARWVAGRQGLWHTAGVHPHDAKSVAPGWLDALASLLEGERAVAVGEAGLDFHRNYSPAAAQRDVFRAQAELAAALRRPLFVHDRDTNGETAHILAASGIAPADVLIHCFTGTQADLERWLEAGYFVGVTGWICDARRGAGLRELAPHIPDDRLVIETDAPFLLPPAAQRPPDAPRPQGRRNEPAFLPCVAAAVAQARETTVERIDALTSANARRFFRLPPVPDAEGAAAGVAPG